MNEHDREEFAVMKNEITHIKDSLAENTAQHKEITELITNFIDKADTKYAPRYVTILAMGSFLTALGIIVSLMI